MSVIFWIRLTFIAERVEAIEEHLEVDLDEVAARVHSHVRDRPTGTPRYRTGLEMSRPLTFSVV